jgi:zinc transport system permease protein
MNDVLDSLAAFGRYGFLGRALLAGFLLALVCGQLSPLVVMRRLSFSADGLAHASLGGLAAGMFLLGDGPTPTPGSYFIAFVFTCALGAVMAWLHRGNRLGSDVAIGASYVAAFAFGVLLLSWKRHYTGHLETLFFGTLLAVHPLDCLLLSCLATVIAVFLFILRRSLERWCFDEELAIAAGVPVEALRAGVLILLAASVVLSVKIVGLLLVTSLLILPGAIGSLVARSFPGILCVSLGAAVVATTGGLVISNAVDVPPGPTSVLLAFATFLTAFVARGLRSRGAPGELGDRETVDTSYASAPGPIAHPHGAPSSASVPRHSSPIP